MEKNKPETKFRAGAISATVWKNKGKNKAGKTTEFFTTKLERRYRDVEFESIHFYIITLLKNKSTLMLLLIL